MKRMKSLKAWALKVLFGMAVLCTIIFSGCGDKNNTKLTKHKVTFSVEGSNGTLTARLNGNKFLSGAEAKNGETVLFTAEPLKGYAVDKWKVNPASALIEGGKEGSTNAKIKVTGAIEVRVSFKSLYIQVAYSELETYLLTKASADGVNYIEVIGSIQPEDFKGKLVGGIFGAGALGKKILAHPGKKVALKLPGKVEGLESMKYCFLDCTNLVSLAGIPEGVKDMERCFSGCTSLAKAPDIPASVTDMEGCFGNCTSLTKAPDIPASVTDMSYCFFGCKSLTESPVIPEGVTNMGGCFAGCKSLTKAPVIPEGVTNMGGCFTGCTSLTQAPAIPEGVTDMRYCFVGCEKLTQGPDIPASVTDMRYCFSGCSALKGVKLLCNYKSAFNNFEKVFENCTALEEGGIKVKYGQYDVYTDPAALNEMAVPPIGNPAEQKGKFKKLPAEYVKVDYAGLNDYLANTASADGVNFIEITGDIAAGEFQGRSGNPSSLGQKILAHPGKKVALKLPGKVENLYSMFACFLNCTNLVSLAGIPSSVTNMGGCFEGCKSLTESPAIPSNVTDMASCFAGCENLTQGPVIPSNVTNMAYCFSGCTSLTESPDIPAKVKNMRGCFSGCAALKGVKLLCNYNQEDIYGEKAFNSLFRGCTALEDHGIKVLAAFYNNYIDAAAINVMNVPPVDGILQDRQLKFEAF